MANKQNKPVKKGVAKVPVVMQLEALECGAACLCMILAYYGKWIPLEQVREDCGVSRDGSNARNVLKAARFYNMTASGYRFETESLRENGVFPCIIHWDFNHFVVLDGFKGNKVYLNDPAKGNYCVSIETFDASFTGICLFMEPNEEFVPSGKPKSVLSFVQRRLVGTRASMVFTILTGVITALMGVISPAFSRVFLDRLLTRQNPDWILPFLVTLGIFDAISIAMTMIKDIYSLRITGKMAAIGNATYMWQVLRLPMRFYSQRMAGDIQGRQSTNANIANALINTFAPLLLNSFMMIFYFVIMIRYSILLTTVGVLSLTVNIVISHIISKKRINITRVSMRDNAMLASATVAGIQMVETIKAAGAESGFFRHWSGYQASVNTQQIRFLKLNRYLGMIPDLVSTLANDAVLVLGVYLVMQGEFTVGSVMAFQGFLSSFMSPAQTLISAGQTIQEMRTQMERVDDVMEYPTEHVFSEEDNQSVREKLHGQVEMKHVVFGYAPLADPLIKDFSMTLQPGKTIAIVGGSGSGKSTVSKLLSGLYSPWSGEILFDGKPMSQIPKNVFRASVCVVDQEIVFMEDTIANNIKMWDDSITNEEMYNAAMDAQIHEDIMARPRGYQHRLIEGGRDFSGGQRQRIEIARVLAQTPTVLIMDEATSALDAKTEYEVVKAVRARGISCIVIAHRLSTIRSCDEIIVLDHGEIRDRGTHEQLIQNSPFYQALVSAE